jgi:hypothetical protein
MTDLIAHFLNERGDIFCAPGGYARADFYGLRKTIGFDAGPPCAFAHWN